MKPPNSRPMQSAPLTAIETSSASESQPEPSAAIAIPGLPAGESDRAAGGPLWRWLAVSGMLLLVYLAFFHLCLNASQFGCGLTGLVAWSIWFAICYCNRTVFKNRFEYFIHQLVGVDILCEGFNPIHQGYGFYSCAVSFWMIFFAYHFLFRR